jgi:hypothetical protein
VLNIAVIFFVTHSNLTFTSFFLLTSGNILNLADKKTNQREALATTIAHAGYLSSKWESLMKVASVSR